MDLVPMKNTIADLAAWAQALAACRPDEGTARPDWKRLREKWAQIMAHDGVDLAWPRLAQYCAHLEAGTARRGLLLMGGTGTGKTFRLSFLVRRFPYTRLLRADDAARRLAGETTAAREDILGCSYQGEDLAIDDLGAEELESVVYGQREQPMIGAVAMRHLLWECTGSLTHISTNLSWSQLEERYGQRTVSRLRAMCNVVALDGADRRRAI